MAYGRVSLVGPKAAWQPDGNGLDKLFSEHCSDELPAALDIVEGGVGYFPWGKFTPLGNYGREPNC